MTQKHIIETSDLPYPVSHHNHSWLNWYIWAVSKEQLVEVLESLYDNNKFKLHNFEDIIEFLTNTDKKFKIVTMQLVNWTNTKIVLYYNFDPKYSNYPYTVEATSICIRAKSYNQFKNLIKAIAEYENSAEEYLDNRPEWQSELDFDNFIDELWIIAPKVFGKYLWDVIIEKISK